MIAQGKFLSEEEIKIVHRDSLRILEEVGVKVPSRKALGILETGGARVDWDRQVAFLPENVVEKALQTAPKEFTLGARNAEYDYTIPSPLTTYNLDGCGVNVLDFETGKRRGAVLSDVANAAKLFERVKLGTVLWPPVSPGDVPKGARSIVSTAASFQNCSKHVQDEVKEPREVEYVMGLARAILGSDEEVRRRKIYSVTYCTVAPLAHDGEMLEGNMELTKYRAPILVFPMPACGTTGPASLRSNIALANAEALSALTIFQLTNPGTPIIYGSALGIVNRQSGIFLEGAVETALQLAACGQMGKSYGLPTIIAGCLSDAKTPGIQAMMEKMMTTMPHVMAGVDVVQGVGLIESSMTMSYEQILLDGEMGLLLKRMKEGVDMSAEKDYFEDIKAVGQEGHFLKQKSTRTAFRSDEFFTPTFSDRDTYEQWTSLGAPGMMAKARKQAEQILAEDVVHPLPTNTLREMEEILEEARAKLG